MASKDNIKVTRRKFLKNSSMGILGASIIGKNLSSMSDQINELPKIKAYRKLGQTGFNVSDIGSGAPVKDTILKALIRSGVNYIDTAKSYFNSNNEALKR